MKTTWAMLPDRVSVRRWCASRGVGDWHRTIYKRVLEMEIPLAWWVKSWESKSLKAFRLSNFSNDKCEYLWSFTVELAQTIKVALLYDLFVTTWLFKNSDKSPKTAKIETKLLPMSAKMIGCDAWLTTLYSALSKLLFNSRLIINTHATPTH